MTGQEERMLAWLGELALNGSAWLNISTITTLQWTNWTVFTAQQTLALCQNDSGYDHPIFTV